MNNPYTVSREKKEIIKHLSTIYETNEAEKMAEWTLDHVLHLDSISQILKSDSTISTAQHLEIKKICKQLLEHKPIQYILGHAHFYGLKLQVGEGVLIPRMETEELVEWIISHLKSEKFSAPKILDIGTGSGAIALALQSEIPEADITAFDNSNKALHWANINKNKLNLSVHIENRDILLPTLLPDRWDIIVSNPPYIRKSEKPLMRENVLNYEPETALFVSDKDPLIFYRSIALFAMKHLNENGYLFFEINEALGKETTEMLKKMNFSEIKLKNDLNNRPRMIRAKKD